MNVFWNGDMNVVWNSVISFFLGVRKKNLFENFELKFELM